jgi:ribosomal protein S27E
VLRNVSFISKSASKELLEGRQPASVHCLDCSYLKYFLSLSQTSVGCALCVLFFNAVIFN